MKQSIYSIFYDKLPIKAESLLPANTKKKITFLNPYYMEVLKEYSWLYKQFDYICSDGIIPILLNKLTGNPKSNRISFDMTSIGKTVLQYAENNKMSTYFIGAKELEIKHFINIIKKEYPQLNIAGFHHGYLDNNENQIIKQIMDLKPNIVIVGMGAPKQDLFAINLQRNGFNGTIYTCGGFIHQTSQKINYYPRWINKLNLRTFYRLYHEPYVWKRVIKYYPPFILKYTHFLLSK